ncbi:hypothetical protein C2G38_2156694 [Gigaspora rosea]|uniref:RNAse P Rpr2/Rpp21/SNM1 subunit domain-containing protein n=1 Tax=Gigaspora rosea TaxID=44941 RepID=A0A397W929_9GLOM|nr:hypothetical protein C2G38_2156694 [Gigaspora rosea]
MNEEDTKKRLHFLWGASHTLLPTVPGLSAFYMQKFNQCAAEEDLNLADSVKRKYCAHCGNIFVPGMNTRVRINVKKKRKRRDKKKKLEISKEGIEERDTPKTITVKKQRRIIYFEPSISSNQISSTTLFQNDLKLTNHRQRQSHKNVLSYFCTLCKTEARFAGSNVIRNNLFVDNIQNTNNQTQVGKVTTVAPTSMTQTSKASASCDKGSASIQKQNSVDSNKQKKKKQKTQLQQLLAEEKRKKDESKLGGFNLENFLSSL